MKNNNRLAVFVKELQRLLNIYLTTPFGCEIAAERMADSTRKRQSPPEVGSEALPQPPRGSLRKHA